MNAQRRIVQVPHVGTSSTIHGPVGVSVACEPWNTPSDVKPDRDRFVNKRMHAPKRRRVAAKVTQ